MLTATVNPGGTPHVARIDQNVRLADYQCSIARWVTLAAVSGWDILIIENSGHPEDSLLAGVPEEMYQQVQPRVLSYVADPQYTKLGKGVGEAHMFDRVVTEYADDFTRYKMIVKVTGRLFVENAQKLLFISPDINVIRCRIRADFTQVDSRFFACNPATWQNFVSNMAAEIREDSGYYLEHAMAFRVAKAMACGVRREPFPRPPRIVGISGSTNVPYGGFRRLLVDSVGVTIARSRPGLFI
ncbi:hypothetical protein [Frankia sp. Cr2]|uniref:hypothetical protein n=1 Tax=Frankia sp. Cr2 TaxID=3073932 RepID=UPI002AD24AEB|nr:hypothetical protein [Frankia sp. Cr2]